MDNENNNEYNHEYNNEAPQVDGPTQAELEQQLRDLRESYNAALDIIKHSYSANVMALEVERAVKKHSIQKTIDKDEIAALEADMQRIAEGIKAIAVRKREAIAECHRSFKEKHNRILHEIAEWKNRRDAAGIVSRRDFNEAVHTIWRYLRQAGKDGITTQVSETKVVSIQFKDKEIDIDNGSDNN